MVIFFQIGEILVFFELENFEIFFQKKKKNRQILS
jgi:hypothetical protein